VQVSSVSRDDVLFGFRLRLFSLAGKIGVRPACRAMGVHHSTYYRWKRRVDRWGLEALRVRERRRPRMPNELGPHLEQRILAFSLAHPGFGPKRISAELARERWAAFGSHPTASGAACVATASTRGRVGSPWSPATPPAMSESLPLPSPSVTSRLPAPASWSGSTAVLTDNGSEFRAGSFVDSLTGLGVEQRRIRAGRPQTNGHVERLQQTILERRGRSPTRESRARCAHRRVNVFFRAFGHNLDYLAGRRRARLSRSS
jgi:transposase InsO family protein